VYFEYICWKFAGRLLDRENTPINFSHVVALKSREVEIARPKFLAVGKSSSCRKIIIVTRSVQP